MVGIGAELVERGEVGKNRVGTADQLQRKQEARPSLQHPEAEDK
jgi:hypothetical protein